MWPLTACRCTVLLLQEQLPSNLSQSSTRVTLDTSLSLTCDLLHSTSTSEDPLQTNPVDHQLCSQLYTRLAGEKAMEIQRVQNSYIFTTSVPNERGTPLTQGQLQPTRKANMIESLCTVSTA